MTGISTHVLDITVGKPAPGISVRLEFQQETGWDPRGNGTTDQHGRCRDLLCGNPLTAGRYRLTFDTGTYFETQHMEALYPEVIIAFLVRDPDQHHHIALLLAPNGYTTYRGS